LITIINIIMSLPIGENNNKYQVVYRIIATPTKTDHIKHTVGYCTTMEIAKKKIGNGTSYDSDDNCGWIYTIEPCDIKDLSDDVVSKINELPSHFPYTGW
jgi:hypothetical protein